MSDEALIELWHLIVSYATKNANRWSNLPPDDLASTAFLEVADKDGEMKEWVIELLEKGFDLDDIARRCVSRVAKRLQREAEPLDENKVLPGSRELITLLEQFTPHQQKAVEDQLRQFLSNLPQEERELLIAYFVERRTLQEIADEIGTTPGAAANRLFRIRKKILRFIEDLGGAI